MSGTTRHQQKKAVALDTDDDAVVEPGSDVERNALAAYMASLKKHYGSRLAGVHLFGSRARGDARAESDADVAVVLEDGDWVFWNEKALLADLAYDVLMEFGLYIQPWPISRSAWADPAGREREHLIRSMHRDARQLSSQP